MKKRILSVVLCLLMLVTAFPFAAFADDVLTFDSIRTISKYGNIKFNTTIAAILEKFSYGDILTVSFGDKTVDVPLCKNYFDVDSGSTVFLVRYDGEDEAMLAINNGNFAESYGIASKTQYKDKSYTWEYYDGFSADTSFTFTLKEKAGYLEEFTVRNIEYTDVRQDYPELTDAQFANFREVSFGKLAKGVLYRSATPVEPIHNRNGYADRCAKEAGITQFINLAENEATLLGYEGYKDTYYASVEHIAVAANVDFLSAENKNAFCEAFRYMAQNDGVYDVHCREGKDRTGMFIAITECLMGATFEEICDDYMVTYYNYYGITKDDAAYGIILNGSFIKIMNKIFDCDIETADLKQEAVEYLQEIGLEKSEIYSLQVHLMQRGMESAYYRVCAFACRIIEFFRAMF